MRKRLLSLFLAMIMSMALMPISAFADELDQPEADSDSITNVEALQTRINALPTAEELEIMEADEQETAYAEVSAIYDALEELSEEELAEIDQTTLEAAAAFFNQQIMPLEEPVIETAIYVSASGSDDNDGTAQDKAVATLAKAVRIAPDGATIYVMDDLEMETGARYWDKSLTITSLYPENPVTVTRGAAMNVVNEDYHDPSRNRYIGSMIEVGGTASGSSTASLTLENIIFDDGGPAATPERFYMQQSTEGTGYFPIKTTVEHEDGTKETVITGYYIYNVAKPSTGLSVVGATEDEKGQKIPDEESIPERWALLDNRRIVHDAIIATYDGTAKITLGAGAVLQNFGGMSAVRISGGELVMMDGSKIVDTNVTDRKKMVSTPGTDPDKKTCSKDYGPAGAVWIQGGTFTMEEGSTISNVIGRAVYLDGGAAYINGTIQNITSDPQMWQGASGSILHLRGNAIGTVGSSCVVQRSCGTLFQVENSDLTLKDNSKIIENSCNNVIFSKTSTVTIAGEIANNNTNRNHVLQTDGNTVTTVEKTGNIHNNTVYYGSLYLNGENETLDFYGKVNKNTSTSHGGGIVLANNGGVKNATMYSGAEICGNTASKTGGGIMVRRGTFTMVGGTISNNSSSGEGGGVSVGRGGQFIMEGGEITNNTSSSFGGGIAYCAGNYGEYVPYVKLLGGTISGNKAKNNSNDLAISLASTSDDGQGKDHGNFDRYFFISDSVIIGDRSIYMQADFKTITPVDDSLKIKFGNASAGSDGCIASLTAASTGKGWSFPIATFWTQRDSAADLIVGGLTTLNSNLPVYVLTQKTGADGKPAEGAEVKVYAAAVEEGNVSFTLPTADVNGNGCAVAIVQPTEDFGTLTITGPEQIKQTLTDKEYPVSYTVTYKVSDNMQSIFNNSTSTPTYSLSLSPDAKLTGTVDTSSFDGKTITVNYTLPFATFDTAEDIFSSALLTITLDGKDYVIPSNAAKTQLIRLPVITFDANGGAFANGSTTQAVRAENGSTVSLPTNPTRSGYTFAGWNTQADGKGTAFTSSNVVNSDLTVYAQWQKKSSDSSKGSSKPATKLNTEDHFSYIIGYKDGTLRPYGTITRGEVATIFFRLLTDETRDAYWSQTNSYSDCGPDLWCNNAISTLSSMGIIDGYEDGTFRPYAKITRGQFAKMAVGFFETQVENYQGYFTDVPENLWCSGYVESAVDAGLIQGFGDGTYRPSTNITRAQACVIVNRALGRKPDEDHLLKERDMITWTDNSPDDWFYADMQEATNSHDYIWLTKGSDKTYMEEWVKKLPQRDWAALEHAWSTAHSAPGGEVTQ